MSATRQWAWIAVTVFAAVLPLAARAGFRHAHRGHCGRCARAFDACGCPQPFCSVCRHAPAQCTCQGSGMPVVVVPQTTFMVSGPTVVQTQPFPAASGVPNGAVVARPSILPGQRGQMMVSRTSPVMPFGAPASGPFSSAAITHGTAHVATMPHIHGESSHSPVPMPVPEERFVQNFELRTAAVDRPLLTVPPEGLEEPSAAVGKWTKVPSKTVPAQEEQVQTFAVKVPELSNELPEERIPSRAPARVSSRTPSAATVWRVRGNLGR